MKLKNFYLSNEAVQMIEDLKNFLGHRSQSETIRYIIRREHERMGEVKK